MGANASSFVTLQRSGWGTLLPSSEVVWVVPVLAAQLCRRSVTTSSSLTDGKSAAPRIFRETTPSCLLDRWDVVPVTALHPE
jgi:hypothetical protein